MLDTKLATVVGLPCGAKLLNCGILASGTHLKVPEDAKVHRTLRIVHCAVEALVTQEPPQGPDRARIDGVG